MSEQKADRMRENKIGIVKGEKHGLVMKDNRMFMVTITWLSRGESLPVQGQGSRTEWTIVMVGQGITW